MPPALAHCPGLGWYVYPGAISCNSFRSGPQIPQEGWSRGSSRQLWHDHKSHFSKASLSQVVRFRKAGSHWCQSLGGICTPQRAAHCPWPWSGPERGEGTTLCQPSLLKSLETSKAQGRAQNHLAVLPPLRAKTGHMVRGRLQLGGTGFDLSLPTLSKTHGSWIY